MKPALLILICSLLLGSNQAFAQSPVECKAMLLQYMDSFGSLNGKERRPYFLHMAVTTVPAKDSPYFQSPLSSQDIDVKIYANERQLVYESTFFAFYQDERESFTVIHPNKLILRAESEDKVSVKDAGLSAQLSTLKRSLIEQGQISACCQVTWNNRSVQEIELIPSEQTQRISHIRRLTYYYEPVSRQVVRQIIDYSTGYRYAQHIITFHQVNPAYKGSFPNRASDFVFAGGRLAERYKTYRLESE